MPGLPLSMPGLDDPAKEMDLESSLTLFDLEVLHVPDSRFSSHLIYAAVMSVFWRVRGAVGSRC